MENKGIKRRLLLKVQQANDGFDRWGIQKYSDTAEPISPIFIVGAPRSGSTLLYQAIAGVCQVGYISNLMALLPRHLIKLARVGRNRMQSVGELRSSDLGFIDGVWSPNEAGLIMREWFDGPRLKVRDELITNTFKSLESLFLGPLLFKNLNNSLRLERIKEIIPNARILFIHRDRIANGASILAARKRFYGTTNRWLGVEPTGFDELLKVSEPEHQVMWQIREIESAISRDSCNWEAENFHCVAYEDLCARPEEIIDQIVEKFGLQFRSDERRCLDKDSFLAPSGNLDEEVTQKLNRHQTLLWGNSNDSVEEVRLRFGL